MTSETPKVDTVSKWEEFYRRSGGKPHNFYPENFVARVFLSSAPVKFLDDDYNARTILDLGAGHGRHIPFLRQLGFSVTGLEVSADQVSRLQEIFPDCTFTEGSSRETTLPDKAFDYVLACNSIYYLEPGSSFEDHMREMSRILKPRGHIVFSMLGTRHLALLDADKQGDGTYIVKSDFLNFREGVTIRPFTAGDDHSLFKQFEILHHGEIVETVSSTCRHIHYFVARNQAGNQDR